VPKLIQTINAYIAANNQQPKPFVWTATPQAILSKIKYRKDNCEASH